MKRNALLSIVVMAVALFWASCSTDYDATPEVPKENIRNPFQGDFTAKLNEEPFTAHTKYTYDSLLNGVRLLSITGQQFNYNRDTTRFKIVSFSISGYSGPKTYYMAQSDISGVYSNIDSNMTYNYLTTTNDTLSSVTITSDQTFYEGKFSLMTVETGGNNDTVQISEGQFKIPK